MSAPVLTWLFHAQGKARESIPCPAIFAMHESTVHQKASSSFCSAQTSARGPLHPTLRANPFPKVTDLFCRLPLPTLFYQPEAVNLGDLMRLWVRTGVQIIMLTWLFKDSWRHTIHLRRQSALPTQTPSSRQSVFRGPRSKKEKKTLSKTPICITKLAYVTIAYPRPGWRILTPFPFKARCKANINRITLPFRID